MTQDKIKRLIPITIVFILIVFFIISINKYNCDNHIDYKGTIGFIIEPQCDNESLPFLNKIDQTDGFDVEIININYRQSVYANLKYFVIIKSSLLNNEDLAAYALGAMNSCGMNRKITFDITKQEDMSAMNGYLDIHKDGEFIINKIGKEIIIHDKWEPNK